MNEQRKIYAKILAITLLGMGLAMTGLYGIVLSMGATPQNLMGRVMESKQALPRIINEPDDLVIMYGSSMVGAGFSPRQFDHYMAEHGKQTKSFNFGFGGLNPFYQDYYSRRIRESFESADRNLKLTIIEFNPFQATQTRWNRTLFTYESYLTMLATDDEIMEIAKDDWARGIRMFTIKYLRGGISAEMITGFFGMELFPPVRPQRFKEDEEVVRRREELGRELSKRFERDYPNYSGADWYYDWQGGGTIPEERSEETLAIFDEYFATLSTDARMQNARARRIITADIEGLNFEPLLVESFIRVVENFKAISDDVEVIMLPRNTKWIHYSPEARQRLNDAIKQIEQATGLKIDDHQSLDIIEPDMFTDASHLNRYQGAVVYTEFLAEKYVERL